MSETKASGLAPDEQLYEGDRMPLSLRTYVPVERKKPGKGSRKPIDRHYGKDLTFVFDTETQTDMAQQLRFGVWHLYRRDVLSRTGIFYDPLTLSDVEQRMLRQFAADKGALVHTVGEFADKIFMYYARGQKATVVGANLFFDLIRIARDHYAARRAMAGGFGLRLARDLNPKWVSRVLIKHLGGRKALVKLTPETNPKGRLAYEGYFVDILMFGNALLSRRDSLKSQGDFLRVRNPKLDIDGHGGPLTPEYLGYAWRDVVTTYECFVELRRRWEQMGITKTEMNKIFSEASIAKAIFKEAGIKPLWEVQPEFFTDNPELVGCIMQTFYGGRVECHIRKEVRQVVYCDATSMYPTVSTLMGLDRFLIAEGMTWHNATREVQDFLDRVAREGVDAMATMPAWLDLIGIAKINPKRDKLPTRTKFNGATDNIALTYLTTSEPAWYALPCLVVSALHERRAPRIIEAIKFEPKEPQAALRPITLPRGVTIDPYKAQIFKSVVELRQTLKKQISNLPEGFPEAEELEMAQYMLKILANAGGYGIFVELNELPLVRPRGKPTDDNDDFEEAEPTGEGPLEPHWRNRICYSGDHAFVAAVSKDEKPGSWFHPLLGTLITSAARLMLACGEILATRRDGIWSADPINWAYCDTDSLTFARPPGMAENVFYGRVQRILNWFNQINPYDRDIVPQLFKIEDVNFKPGSKTEFQPLYIYAISSKRYVVFNLTEDRRPVIRKASAHGLGYLVKPYQDDFEHPDLPPLPGFILAKELPEGVKHHGEMLIKELGVHRWQYDLWYLILDSVVLGHGDYFERLGQHPKFDQPAMIQHTVRTTEIEDWFNGLNANKEYRRRVRPGNFISAWSPLDEIPLDGHWQNTTTLAEDKAARRSYTAKLNSLGISAAATRAKIEAMKPSDWHPVGPFTKDDPWRFKNAIDRVTGLPIPPWIEPRTYAMALLHYHEMPEPKFLNGDSSGEMVCRHIIADQIPTYIGKATNKLDEAEIPELCDPAEFVENYIPNSRTGKSDNRVPAKDARDLLADQLSVKPKIRQVSREIPPLVKAVDETAYDELTEDQKAAFRLLLEQWNLTEQQWRSDIIRAALIGDAQLQEVAAQLGMSKGQLSNIIAGRRSIPERVSQLIADATAEPLGADDLWQPELERTGSDLNPAAASAPFADMLYSDMIEAHINREECYRLIFNPWPIVPREAALSTVEVLERYEPSTALPAGVDWSSVIESLSSEVLPVDDDDVPDPDQLE